MPLPPRLFPGDEELGKKDDEYKPGNRSRVWQQRRLPHAPPRRTAKRVAFGILAVIALYYFVKNIPTDGKRHNARPQFIPNVGQQQGKLPINQGVVVKPAVPSEVERSFNGPIKFFDLASTLHSAGRMIGSSPYNRNVLFAAASLKSAATLLPIACEMALRERNDIHFAFMGRDDIPIDMLKSVNGVTQDCKINFHDARPDFSRQSTDFRMEVSCSAAFKHINNFVHPQATLIDGSGLEELFFLKGVNDRAIHLGKTIIELPENTEQSLMWVTLLDSSSLSAWNKVTVDLIVHAQPAASGSLMRLLESLKNADFFSSTPPRLTIELPHEIDEATKRYLEHFKWPPAGSRSSGSLLTLHHRIPQYGLTGEENSIRFLESFWPADPSNSHVMVLSPQAELSPLFFHYLKYTMLEYKYSSSQYDSTDLLGISLDLPPTYLNDSTTFTPPRLNNTATPFLWQAPNSNAALYFGEKWVELHNFISHLLQSQHKLPTPTTLNTKEVSKTYPSWLEHILKLARARGYATIYPHFKARDSLVTLHNDLYQPPEEYEQDLKEEKKEAELGADMKDHLSLKHKEQLLVNTGLLTILNDGGRLPLLADMPTMRFDGEIVEGAEMERGAAEFKKVFRREIGGCDEKDAVVEMIEGEVVDLFCLNDKRAT